LALIILVDDDAAFRSAVARLLRRAGHVVREARDGVKALDIMVQTRPELVVTDVLMPNCDGIELISRLRRDYPEVRILAVSARESLKALSVLSLARNVGAHATLAKSVVADRLLPEVDALMSIHH
jgi:CheY-like chemotaxis protein